MVDRALVTLESRTSGTLAVATLPAFTGDVTTVIGTAVTTIAGNVVTNAKLADMPASTIKGNNTVLGDPLDLTVAQVKVLLAIAAADVSGLAAIATTGSASNLIAGTVPAAQMPALTGDVTSVAGAVATTLRAGAATSVIGRSVNTVGAVADIAATLDGQVLRRAGGGLAFGDVPQASVTSLVADLAARVPTTRSVLTAAPLTGGGALSADRTLAITSFAGAAAGAVPVSAGGTANFLRTDGLWANALASTMAAGVAGKTAFAVSATGTYDTTAAVLTSTGLSGSSTTTRSAGANNLTNVGASGSASGAQKNRGMEASATGAGTENIGVYCAASGATGNYALYGAGEVYGDTISCLNFSMGGGTVTGMPGRLLMRREITGSPYVPTAGTRRVICRMVGAGGGGGGSTGAASSASAGGGGGSGQFIEFEVNPGAVVTGSTFTSGTAGAAGAAAGGSGGLGGDTTIIIHGVTYTAKGGTGGLGMGSGSTITAVSPGAPVAGSTAVTVLAGSDGGFGIRLSGVAALSGQGGSNPIGQGGASATGATAGNSGRGRGAGGSGGVATTTSTAGGVGTGSMIIVEEYS